MAFNDKQRQIDEQAARIETLEEQLQHAQTELQFAQRAGDVVLRAEAAESLRHLDEAGVMEEEAEAIAEQNVGNVLRSTMVREMADGLVKAEYDRFAAKVRETEGPEIKANLEETLEADGTFARERKRARDDVRAEIQAELLAEAKQRALEVEGTEEKREAYRAAIRPEVMASEEVQQHAADVRKANEAGWYGEVAAEAQAEIDAEEAAREEDYKNAAAQEYKDSERGQKYRMGRRAKLHETWDDAWPDAVAAEIDDEELKALLTAKAEREKEKLRKEEAAAKLLEAFEGRGVDTAALPADTRITIYLGEMGEREKKTTEYNRRTGRNEEVVTTQTVIVCQRVLELTAEGDGKFTLDGDSLLAAKSPYLRNDAIEQGTTLTIGRVIHEQKEERLGGHVVADVNLYYDADNTDGEITDSEVPVANIVVDGISARKYDVVQMV